MTQFLGLEKIANLDSGGMLATVDSVAYHAHVCRRALNFYERWYGDAVTPAAGTHEADRVGAGVVAFEIDGGAGAGGSWGSWVQILGSSDTTTGVYYNLHKLMITYAERAATYFMQLGFGATGDGAVAAGTYTEFVYKPNSTSADEIPYVVRARRQAIGTKAWARCFCLSQDTAKLQFYLGIIEYEG